MRPRHRTLLIALAATLLLRSVSDTLAAAAPAPSASGGERWIWPLAPRPEVVRVFDPPEGPYGAGHRGIDLSGRIGQSVLAVADGRVRFVGMVAGRGVVVIEHGDERSTYEPVIGAVDVGDRVRAGQVVGRLELVASHCWPSACLHLGRLTGETYLDPLELLVGGTGPVRLLPFHDAAGADAASRGRLVLGGGTMIGAVLGPWADQR
jgi:hypothetical protein